ncbi:MAG: SDR family NAD(P)-dependent oxidoreductase [Phycisphaerales bacterium]|nr:SDR family NAD(P)-dependent oxidoreductase [Phycisphaerales bacterium]
MSSVLLTGGAGFIGSHLAEALLARGDAVTIIDDFAPFYPRAIKERNLQPALRGGANLIEGDITSAADVKRAFDAARPDAVVHLAACAGVRPSIAEPARYAHVNVVGTQRLLDAAVQAGAQHFIVASSSSVYGNNSKVPFAETDDVSRPISPYAATKVATELICSTAAHLHHLSVTALRFFTVFGPRQRPDLAIHKFLKRIAQGEAIPVFGDGSTSRDYTYIDDIIDGVIRAIDRCGQVERFRCYNLGGEHPVTLAQMIEAAEQTVGRRAVIDRQGNQPGDVVRTWADLTRSRAELGYEPRTSLVEGMARQWQWLRAEAR